MRLAQRKPLDATRGLLNTMKYAIRLTHKRTRAVTWIDAYFCALEAATTYASNHAAEWRDYFVDIRPIADVPSPQFISPTEGFK